MQCFTQFFTSDGRIVLNETENDFYFPTDFLTDFSDRF